jgi:hypothetical protein
MEHGDNMNNENNDDEEDNEDDEDDEEEENYEAVKNAMEMEDIEEFDSVAPSGSSSNVRPPQSSVAVAAVVAANEPTRAEALLIAYADKNSIDADELKQFMKDYVQIKFAD